MRITWSVPVTGERLGGTRGDLVRAWRLIQALRDEGHEIEAVEVGARPAAEAAVSAYRQVVRRMLPRRPGLVLRDAGRWVHASAHGRHVAAVARAQRAELLVETQVHFAGSGVWATRHTGVPLVLDDCSPISEAEGLGAGLPILARHVFRRQMEAALWLSVSSEALREWLVGEGAPAQKLRVVPNGIDPAAHEHVDRDAVRRRLGLNGRCVLGFVGSFQPWHAVERLVEALPSVSGERPVHVLLVGDGPGRTATLAAVQRLGLSSRVTVLGAVPPAGVPELIAACDVGVLPASNDYGHPMKLLEYAAAGLPSVAPNLAPVREVVSDGVTGLLFPPADQGALSRALSRLATDEKLRHALGARARDLAASSTWRERARALVAHVGVV